MLLCRWAGFLGCAGGAMRDTKIILILLAILTFLTLGFVLNLLQAILIPLVVAIFLFQIFTPLMGALRARRVPASLAILIVLIVVSAVLLLSSWILYSTLSSFSDSLPRYQHRLTEGLDHASTRLVSAIPRLRGPIARFRWEEALEISSITSMVAAGLGSFLVFFSDLVLILLFLVFLLLGSESFPLKLGRALNPRHAERVAEVLHNIEEQVRRYLLLKTLINLGNGTVVAILFASFGVDFPLLWGFVTFLAHYIPQIGGVLSVGLPTVFLLLQFDSVGWALFVAGLNMAVQFIIGNVIEPEVMGERLDLSPMLVLLSLIFWGWLWGPWGMVLAVPIAATIRIVCENVRPLQPIAVLMSDSAEAQAPETVTPEAVPEPAPPPAG
jgi:predicted PurR-regulated permease PerM